MSAPVSVSDAQRAWIRSQVQLAKDGACGRRNTGNPTDSIDKKNPAIRKPLSPVNPGSKPVLSCAIRFRGRGKEHVPWSVAASSGVTDPLPTPRGSSGSAGPCFLSTAKPAANANGGGQADRKLTGYEMQDLERRYTVTAR
jgi:hypothetical protein